MYLKDHLQSDISPIETKKGVIAVEIRSVENQKDVLGTYTLCSDSALLVLYT